MEEFTVRDCRILVVEDEYMLADDLTKALSDAGAVIIGPAPTVDAAMQLIEKADRIDGAVLDINLAGQTIYPAADALIERGIPLIFVTGYDASAIPPHYSRVPRCDKPISLRHLAKAIGNQLHK